VGAIDCGSVWGAGAAQSHNEGSKTYVWGAWCEWGALVFQSHSCPQRGSVLGNNGVRDLRLVFIYAVIFSFADLHNSIICNHMFGAGFGAW
jgi:hypothetical protein